MTANAHPSSAQHDDGNTPPLLRLDKQDLAEAWIQTTIPSKRISSLSLVSISEIEALEGDFKAAELADQNNNTTPSSSQARVGTTKATTTTTARRMSRLSHAQSLSSHSEEDEDIIEESQEFSTASIASTLNGSFADSWDSSQNFDVIGGICDSIKGGYAKKATFRKPKPFGCNDDDDGENDDNQPSNSTDCDSHDKDGAKAE